MNNKKIHFSDSWAVILGGSSGFGLASVEKLASNGMNIAVLYRETAAAERSLKERFSTLAETYSISIIPFNVNALVSSGRETFIEQFKTITGKKQTVRLLLHSIARGNLKPLVLQVNEPDIHKEILSVEDIGFTSYAMSTSILDWVRALIKEDLFQPDARIIGITSEGSHKYWEGYAAVSIAKASLESLATYMAIELSKYGLKTNLIQAGITETPSLKRIQGSDRLLKMAKERNPFGRLTSPSDVANVIYLLCSDEASWINGSLIHVDGGEHCK